MEVLADLGHGYFACGALARLGYLWLVQCVQVRACATAAGPIGSTLAVAMQTIRRLLWKRATPPDFMLVAYHR